MHALAEVSAPASHCRVILTSPPHLRSFASHCVFHFLPFRLTAARFRATVLVYFKQVADILSASCGSQGFRPRRSLMPSRVPWGTKVSTRCSASAAPPIGLMHPSYLGWHGSTFLLATWTCFALHLCVVVGRPVVAATRSDRDGIPLNACAAGRQSFPLECFLNASSSSTQRCNVLNTPTSATKDYTP